MPVAHRPLALWAAVAAVAFGGLAQAGPILYDHDHDHDHGDFVLGGTYNPGGGSPGKWGPPALGTGATVTWSFMPGGLTVDGGGTSVALSSFMPVGFENAIRAAFAAWSAVANITFVEILDNGLNFDAPGAVGDIRVGAHAFDGAGGVLAHGFFPPNNGVTAAGDIHFDSGDLWKLAFGGPGFSIFQVMAHEIGHAIGLGHTGVPNSLMNPFYTESFTGLQPDDIAGARFIYGNAVTAVPEPSSLLVFAAVGVVGWAVRRRVKQAA